MSKETKDLYMSVETKNKVLKEKKKLITFGVFSSIASFILGVLAGVELTLLSSINSWKYIALLKTNGILEKMSRLSPPILNEP
jgi:uncharacterized membrane protein YoaK (UPF0700 family)